MRSLLFVITGIVLWGVTVWIGRWQQIALQHRLVFFCGIWFAVALINMWLGVAAGYSVMEELPIFFFIFSLPCIVAILSYKRF